MTLNAVQPRHSRHAILVEALREYLAETGKSARWLGLNTPEAGADPRLLPNLARGRDYPASVRIALSQRLIAYYRKKIAEIDAEEAAERETTALLRAA